jgi:hypothetical protein
MSTTASTSDRGTTTGGEHGAAVGRLGDDVQHPAAQQRGNDQGHGDKDDDRHDQQHQRCRPGEADREEPDERREQQADDESGGERNRLDLLGRWSTQSAGAGVVELGMYPPLTSCWRRKDSVKTSHIVLVAATSSTAPTTAGCRAAAMPSFEVAPASSSTTPAI